MRVLISLLLALPLLASCGGDNPTVVALLVADEEGATQPVDVAAFEERARALCEECDVVVHDAGGDEDEQKSQARQALAASADVVVVDPVDPDSVRDVNLGEVPMVSLVTLVPGSERFVGLEGELPAGAEAAGTVLDAARDIVLGRRASLTYVPSREMSEQSADVAVRLLADAEVSGAVDHEGVPSWLYEAIEVRLANLTTVLVGRGVITIEDLCEGETAKRCEKLGLR